jgi:Transposase zinc-binding domain/Putative transposase
MGRPSLEVADIFRGHGAAWRHANRGGVSLDQLKVMSAIENCRTAALGGHVARCEDCAHTVIAYNSCRNRHCPKCQGAAARAWMAARETELLPVSYFHVVFTLPSAICDIAYHNKAVIYGLLFSASAETMLTIAADPRHLGARIGITSVLHSWGSAMTHHPHVHMIVPGGGGLMQAQLLPAGAGSLEAVPPVDAHQAGGGTRGGQASVLRRPCTSGRRQGVCGVPSLAQKDPPMPSAHSLAQNPCSPICRATPTVSLSQTTV